MNEVQTEDNKFRLRSVVLDQDTMFLRGESKTINLDNGIPQETLEVIDALKKYVIEHNGLGMAAVQLGVQDTVFVMRKPWKTNNLVVVINPRIIRRQGKSKKAEGCFSLPMPNEMAPLVSRSSIIWVNFTDEDGVFYEEEMLVGMDARVFQHEYDHLKGVLAVDQPHFIKWTYT